MKVVTQAPEDHTTERESATVRREDAEQLGVILRKIRKREVDAAQERGESMNLGSWISRLADDLDEDSPDTVKKWVHGETFPEWTRFKKLVAKFGAELRNALLPCDEDDNGNIDKLARIQAILNEPEGGQ